MRALITGGAGFVGRHLTNRLLQRGDQVTVVDNLSSGVHPAIWPQQPVNKFEWMYDNIRNYVKRSPAGEFDVVFHLAAVVGGRLTIEGDPLLVATDLAIDSDVFNWIAESAKRPKLIYFSSSAVYPVELQTEKVHCALSESLVHFNGTRISMPDMTYGWAKLTGEYLARFAVENYGMDVVVYRPFSGYGEDQSFDYPFPSIIGRVMNGHDTVTVWGSGQQARDFIYVEDVIDCVFATMNKLPPGSVLNIGSGVATDFLGLAWMAGAKNVVSDPSKPEGVFWRVADTTKMKEYYQPVVSLEEGIERVKQAILTRKKA